MKNFILSSGLLVSGFALADADGRSMIITCETSTKFLKVTYTTSNFEGKPTLHVEDNRPFTSMQHDAEGIKNIKIEDGILGQLIYLQEIKTSDTVSVNTRIGLIASGARVQGQTQNFPEGTFSTYVFESITKTSRGFFPNSMSDSTRTNRMFPVSCEGTVTVI